MMKIFLMVLCALALCLANGNSVPCYDAQSRPQRCVPEFENAAFNLSVEATNTCGEYRDTRYCRQTGVHGARGRWQCYNCASGSHPARYLTDFHSEERMTRWQSETMYEDIQYPNSVNLTIHLGKSFEITYIRLKFYSPRPESFAIYKRTCQECPWIPYQYYSGSCRSTYNLADSEYVSYEDERKALCTSEFSDISPLTGGYIAFSTLENRPSARNFDNSPILQDWVTATDILVMLTRLNTFGDEVFRVPDVLRSYFYAINDFSIGGRCKCNGHASQCVEAPNDPYNRLVCKCKHNTAGPDCGECLPLYNDRKWRRATAESANECVRCNCNSRADRCFFDEELFNRTGSGGHCMECRDDTAGVSCERCRDNYFRTSLHDRCEPRNVDQTETCTVDRLYNGGVAGRRITYNHGENITFTCNPGYEKEYESYWCNRGTALPTYPRCVQASCNTPNLPDHMISSQSRFAHGSVLNVSCEHGFHLSANQQQPRCWFGVWTRSLDVTCQRVSCPEPRSNSLSTVEALSIPGIQGYVHGVRVRYSCIEGWEIEGIAERECDNGRWTGFPPACRIAARQCPPLQTPTHAVPGPCPPPYTTGKMCTHRCREGYTRTGGNPTRLCNIQSEWTGTPLSCEPEVGIPNNCNPDLQFIETPQNEIHSEGDFVNPKCRVNDEEMIVTWHKDGQKLDSGVTNDIIVDQFNDLYIPSFDSRHEGHYACVVFSGDDTECLRAEANFTLNPLSFFSHLPEDSYIDMETVDIVTFMCSPADETWEIVWEKDGEALEDPFTVNGNLVLQDIEEADEGKYTCVVRDPWGRSTGRADAWLFLNDPPLIDISAVCGTITPMLDNTNPTVTPELSSVEEWSSFGMMGQPGDDDGNEAVPRSSRIVGGTTAEFGSAPYMVQISELRDREWTNICGGTLLDQQWVLTAAHCMFEEDTHIPIQNDNMRLLFGEYDTLVQEGSELPRRPAAIIVHEEYRHDERTFDNDIALIRIEPPIREFTTSIRPICLAPYTLSSRLMRNSVLGRVTGWGRQVSLGPHSRFLKEVAVPFVDRHTCQESVDDDEGVFTENMFCAGYHSAQRDACSGDSGGPLAVRYDDGRWYQLGIVSWGIGCAEEGEYGFYTHVSRFLHWLRSKNVTVAYSSEVGVRFNNSRGSGVLAFTVRSRSNLTVTAGSTVDLECVPNRDDASVEWFIGNSLEPVNMLVDGVRILPSGLVFHFDAIVEEFAGAYSCVARLDDGEGEQVIRADFQIQVTPA